MTNDVIPKYIEKECSKHGLYKYVLEGRGTYRCTKCRSEAVTKRRKKVKELLVEYKGGQCEKCGYNRCIGALEFHHLDPSKKDFGISSGNTLKLDIMKKETDKCILVCSNCHKEIHDAP
jgi:DNA-directed RNA polymerase subunit RPC12/RpoP